MKLRSLIHTNWLATFRLNYHAGGWKAVRLLPIRVYGPLKLKLEGKTILPPDATKNMIVIGSDHEDYTASSGKAELNIQGTWCYERDSYMHTPSIAASRNSHRTIFHIARGGSGQLLL